MLYLQEKGMKKEDYLNVTAGPSKTSHLWRCWNHTRSEHCRLCCWRSHDVIVTFKCRLLSVAEASAAKTSFAWLLRTWHILLTQAPKTTKQVA